MAKTNFPELPHVPFCRDERYKEKDGVYRTPGTDHVHIVKNVWLRSVIPEGKSEPIRQFTCSLRSTNPEIGSWRRIIISNVNWELLLKL